MSDNNENNGEILYCSFCGKSQAEVKKLVAGRGVYICDECIEVCINIVADEMNELAKTKAEIRPNICRRRPKSKNFWISMLSDRNRRKKYFPSRFTIIIKD